MLVSRRGLWQKLRACVASSPASIRAYGTNAIRDEGDSGIDTNPRRDDRELTRRGIRSPIFGGVVDPLSSRSLSQIFNLMDQMMENPFVAASRGMGVGSRKDFDVKEDGDALRLRIDMPGLSKENVKISVEQNTLVIKGEGDQESGEEEGERYSSRIDLPAGVYNVGEIKAEMKNGVLKVQIPKVKEDERGDVFHVKID